MSASSSISYCLRFLYFNLLATRKVAELTECELMKTALTNRSKWQREQKESYEKLTATPQKKLEPFDDDLVFSVLLPFPSNFRQKSTQVAGSLV